MAVWHIHLEDADCFSLKVWLALRCLCQLHAQSQVISSIQVSRKENMLIELYGLFICSLVLTSKKV